MPGPIATEVLSPTAEVDYVLSGAARPAPPFTHDTAARIQAVALTEQMFDRLNLVAPPLAADPSLRLALIHKLLAHLSRIGCQTPETIAGLSQQVIHAADVIADRPKLADDPINFAGILRLRPPPQTLNLAPDTPPRPVIWRCPDEVHHLEELTHPCHLLYEGYMLKHCIATQYDEVLLRDSGLERGTPSGSCCLSYWKLIEDSDSRIFSLARAEQPRASLRYLIAARTLIEYGARSQITGREPFFAALIEAIVHLSHLLRPLRLGRHFFANEEIISALTKRVSGLSHRRHLYPQHPLNLI